MKISKRKLKNSYSQANILRKKYMPEEKGFPHINKNNKGIGVYAGMNTSRGKPKDPLKAQLDLLYSNFTHTHGTVDPEPSPKVRSGYSLSRKDQYHLDVIKKEFVKK
jgi:hypothetical protein